MTATLAPPEPDVALDYPDTLLIANHPDTDPLDEDDVPEAFYTTNAPVGLTAIRGHVVGLPSV
ncbi:hypothetical protein [Corynebacterium kefirresidentii]|uniref:hypothetical protein n=1 Tax=Corynebacterium kefirresidentii TaxID=1979527 RepID=UPI000A3AC3ED|nr:hypothetical protein [Corynebacterium kefirresidentii]OUJ21502.1 hypothetical protein CBI45_12180 [Corynebacterium kefirresidentii]